MAKRGRRPAGPEAALGGDGTEFGNDTAAQQAATEDMLGNFAEDLGRILGSAQSKATAWMDQRRAITEQLTQIRDTASQYLQQLTGANASGAAGARAARGGGTQGRAGSRRKKRTMSAEARAKIAEAQRKRLAKHRKEAS